MNKDEIEAVVRRELQRIAPEADIGALGPDRDVREELDIDSMDFLRFVTALDAALGVGVPESDYRRIATVRGCTDHLAKTLAQRAA
ncbi:acyl carrier protein [Sorangium sp. So ce302]|uniref:acyl carrier protein n=1 Tax=Sorangium sp. So ce302 TaxID=3133297 RepID=UPI003F5E723F